VLGDCLRIKSSEIFDKLGYDYRHWVEPSSKPELSKLKFSDIVPEFSKIELGSFNLYKHQFAGYNALVEGNNLILISGTGSGKTEAWILYAISKIKESRGFKVLALYPTLALANDQIKRISRYLSLIGKEVLQIDSVKKAEYIATRGRSWLKQVINTVNIVISNPAFILHDIKKLLINPRKSLLHRFYKGLNLLIVDEIDFYGPRSIALLLALIKIICDISDEAPQIVVLTATLSNPDDLGRYLEKVTGRKTTIVRGKPFNIENHVYIVLGKNIKALWNKLREKRRAILEKARNRSLYEELSKALESYEYFSRDTYKWLLVLQSIGVETPSLSIDPSEVLSAYLHDKYVTIVFTHSISLAEEVVRSVKTKIGREAPIASHHHLVPKKEREKIEEHARKGLLKVIVSPRTLSQGIDIGTVARIVHLGLPSSVREFVQREGRKGRREEVGFSETVIIPFSRWDKELLAKGIDALSKWLGMGIEKTLINPENMYIHLFIGLAKIRSPWYKGELSTKEREALEAVGVISSKGVNEDLAKWIYERMNFYEFAPPYGIKRYLVKGEKKIPLEPIGHCDLVEKFQPGNIDYSEEAIVTRIDTGHSTRHVRAVYEEPISEVNFYRDDAFSIALEEYQYIKMQWGEKPNILRDILSGRLTSEELCVVYVPRKGFGRYRKIPDRCIWKLRSEKPRVKVLGDHIHVYYDRRQIYVPKPTGGEYRDYTYGYLYSVEPGENSELMRLALASLMIILRRVYGVAFETIMYDVIKLGEYKYFSLHEPEAAGIIESIDWLDVRKKVQKYRFDELDPILLAEIDELAYSILISYELNWELVRSQIIRLIDYILALDKIRIMVGKRELTLPKPSPALRLLSLSPMAEVIDEDSEAPKILVALAVFNGEETESATALYPPIPYIRPPQDLLEIEKKVMDWILYDDYKLIVANREAVLRQLKLANLKQLVLLIEKFEDKVLDLSVLAEKQGIKPFSYDALATAIGEEDEVIPQKIQEIVSRIGGFSLSKNSSKLIRRYLELQAKKTYLAYLIIETLSKKRL